MSSPELVWRSFVVWHFENCLLIKAQNFEQLDSRIRQEFCFDANDSLEIRDGQSGYKIISDDEFWVSAENHRKLHVLNTSSGERWDKDLLAHWLGLNITTIQVNNTYFNGIQFGDRNRLEYNRGGMV